MAPAILSSGTVSSGTARSFCPASSATKTWQVKRLVSPGSALTRPPPHANMDMASIKASIPVRPLDSAFARRRRSGLRPETRSSSSRRVLTGAVEGSVTVEEPSPAPVSISENSEEESAEPDAAAVTAVPPKIERFKPRIPGQKARREDPTVPAEALVEGAVFTGKVTTIQPFGAFVNFGAFTDGLVHISKMSTGYVSNVSDIVTLGQEVKVTIISIEQTSGRIALSMVDKEEKEAKEAAAKAGEAREGGERSRFNQGPDGRPVNRGRIAGAGRQNKRDEPQKVTKLSKGQEVEGTVKNKIRSGVFVEFPEDEEGFLRYSDIPGGENMAPESSLQVGDKVKATVLRIDRGKVVLTMKPIVDILSVNRDINKGKPSDATNPFEIAFRAFNLIPPEPLTIVEEDGTGDETLAATDVGEEVPDTTDAEESPAVQPEVPAEEEVVADAIPEVAATAVTEAPESIIPEAASAPTVQDDVVEKAPVETSPPAEEEIAPASVEDIVTEATSSVLEEEIAVTEDQLASKEEEEVIPETASAESVPDKSAALEDGPVAEDKVASEAIPEVAAPAVAEVDSPVAEDEVASEAIAEVAAPAVAEADGPVAEDEVASEAIPEVAAPAVAEADSPGAEDEVASEAIPEVAAPAVAEASVAVENVIPESVSAPAVEEAAVKKAPEVISPALVKQLRDETGAGMMDCKRALTEAQGDIDNARETLRKKGLASAEKKASRIATEGLIGSYIHDSRIGVLVEVNCETDFVSRGPAFKSLVEDVAMQVVASQQVQFVAVEDIPTEVVNKEKELEAQREDLISKPEAIRAKIVEGRVSKRLNEFALLEQPYIRDDKIAMKDLVKQTVATLGENIKVRRFERYVLGEGLQKKGTDFAAEVAAQTAVKAPKEPVEAPVESPETKEAPVSDSDTHEKVEVSAALVKELRGQTGAGMMDCKKALASCANDLEKAAEFLHKKGLAGADKKASRIASEGLIGTYIHDGRIGILIEVNCETDFVARGGKFKELVEDLAMQAAAYPLVQVVSVDDVPADVVAKEKELESGKEDLASKPEAIRARIVDGRVAKRLSELALLDQPFIKDDKKLVKDIVKETIAALGENIQVRRFTRFNLGEGIEKKVVDFASEVAAQSGRKA